MKHVITGLKVFSKIMIIVLVPNGKYVKIQNTATVMNYTMIQVLKT